MMEKVDLPKGLIRFASEDNIAREEQPKFTLRIKAYTGVLTILVGVLIAMLFMRNALEANVLRLPGQLYTTNEANEISNVYTYKLINKTTHKIDNVTIKLMSHQGTIRLVGEEQLTVPRQNLSEGTFFIDLPLSELSSAKEKIKIGIYRNDELIETTTTNFLGPKKY